MPPRPPLNEVLALFQATVAAEGTTTGPGAAAGNSIIDAGLIGVGANSFLSMLMVVYPGQPRLVDSMDITGFNNATGEVTLSTAYKGVAAAIPAGVPYKIVTFRFVPAEVAALAASLGLMADAATADDLSNVTTTSAHAKLRRLLLSLSKFIIATGTFTTSSAIAPVDTSRTEPNNAWSGCTLLPLSGAVAFQPRTISVWDGGNWVFHVDDNPFTAPTGLVPYAILSLREPLPPTVDNLTGWRSAGVIGHIDDSTYPDFPSARSLVAWSKSLWQLLTGWNDGTFTFSSATVPRDSNFIGYNNDFFKGCLILSLSLYEVRRIVAFNGATGEFTIDPNNPFTAAPGLTRFVIISSQTPFIPAADGANNRTPEDVTGNKADTIPAMNLAPGATDSLVRHVKAILERLGATPADPDDSVLTNIGQRDDAATNDDMSDITTTSIEAKLRLILNRLSIAAFTATIQGAARTELDTMLYQLATYISALGAAYSATVNPGAAAKDNLEQTLEDLGDMLAGATGIVTFPAAAAPGNGVSLAEIIRFISDSGRVATVFTATASTTTTITDAALANIVGNYVGQMVVPLAGNMQGQGMPIVSYDGASVLAVDPGWAQAPGNVAFTIVPAYGYILTKAIFDLVNGIQVTKETGGSITTDGTEQTAYINNAPAGVYKPLVFKIDCTNMIAGDEIHVRVSYRIVSGGALVKEVDTTYNGAQDPDLKPFTLSANRFGVQISVQRTAGVDRAYPWAIIYED